MQLSNEWWNEFDFNIEFIFLIWQLFLTVLQTSLVVP